MRFFYKKQPPPGTRIFRAGLVLVGVMIVGTLGFVSDPRAAETLMVILLLGPPLGVLGFALCIPACFLFAKLAGTQPDEGLYRVAASRRNWRGVAGACLLTSALLAALVGLFTV